VVPHCGQREDAASADGLELTLVLGARGSAARIRASMSLNALAHSNVSRQRHAASCPIAAENIRA
jgi:hypothetical protein